MFVGPVLLGEFEEIVVSIIYFNELERITKIIDTFTLFEFPIK
jgi:hypothetical protein